MKKLDPSEWLIQPWDDDHIMISIYENNGYRHWTKVRI